MQKTYISLLRHGEVHGGGCYRGLTDDALTALGWQQMQQAVVGFTGDFIISSPLTRCVVFAQDLSVNTGVPLVQEPAFREIDFGDWEGLTANAIDAQQLAAFYANPREFTPPNAEPFLCFQEKILQAWSLLLARYTGKRILLITHAGVIRVILEAVFALQCGQGFQFEIGYGCVSRLCCFTCLEQPPFVQLLRHG